MKNTIYIIGVFLIIFFAFSCNSNKKVTKKKNFAYIYNPTSTSLHPEYLIYHKSESVSLLMIKFYPGELLFNQTNEDKEFRAELKFSYRVFEQETKDLIDSSSATIEINLDEVQEEMISFIPFKATFGSNYVIQIITKDVKRNSQHRMALNVNKKDKYNSQNYIVRKFGTSAPIFNSRLDSTIRFFIEYAHGDYDSLNVKFYESNFFIPNPPSINVVKIDKLEIPDSQYVLRMSDTNIFRINKKGLYTFQVDTGELNGIRLSYFSESYPFIVMADDLAEPLSYLMNDNDFKKLEKNINKKLAVDNFWLDAAKDNIEIARELIRIYYNRAYLANYYFTSYKEGWKTDRGMIYMIYGLPNYIYKSDVNERWIYEEIQGPNELYFKFKRIQHPFTENHYILERSELLQTRWKDAVESWKNGKPYTFN
ncbi:GWxTD domain-containing protein [Bacteroidota bacterium]